MKLKMTSDTMSKYLNAQLHYVKQSWAKGIVYSSNFSITLSSFFRSLSSSNENPLNVFSASEPIQCKNRATFYSSVCFSRPVIIA